jgi:hypothetical protein
VLYTPEFERFSPGDPTGVELLVEMSRPAMIIPSPRMAVGTIQEIHRPAETEMAIPFDHIVIAGYGTMGGILSEYAHVGEQIGISLELRDLGFGCESPESEDWTKTYAGIEVGVAFLQDGEVVHDTAPYSVSRHPRTAIAFNDQYVYFVVVDGRSEGYSVGMTLDQLGAFVRDELDATYGLNLDGGGSSTMWVNGTVENSPSDGHERPVPDGLMMVSVEPMVISKVFRPGARVQTTRPVELRLGPGYNYAALTALESHTEGVVRRDDGGLGGVRATGVSWWPIEFEGMIGWAPQDSLVLLLAR